MVFDLGRISGGSQLKRGGLYFECRAQVAFTDELALPKASLGRGQFICSLPLAILVPARDKVRISPILKPAAVVV